MRIILLKRKYTRRCRKELIKTFQVHRLKPFMSCSSLHSSGFKVPPDVEPGCWNLLPFSHMCIKVWLTVSVPFASTNKHSVHTKLEKNISLWTWLHVYRDIVMLTKKTVARNLQVNYWRNFGGMPQKWDFLHSCSLALPCQNNCFVSWVIHANVSKLFWHFTQEGQNSCHHRDRPPQNASRTLKQYVGLTNPSGSVSDYKSSKGGH